MGALRWVQEQVRGGGSGDSRETPIGIVPTAEAIGAHELGLSAEEAEMLLSVDPSALTQRACIGDRCSR